ncbi:hypothetical protein [uncultured Celeribacter sp.]|uniref:hypothetical protein n=1 Tax=uncultured Celeribacter sp. TaxID=1303376 RepID=UPI002AA93D53|nr:hypothetical protein [uncultured Celeribacter sp.]
MSDKTRKIAVLTGDLVNSTGLGPEKVERAFVALEDCAEMQAEWMGGQSLHFTRHRGDGWQVALAEPKYALRSALCFRAALRALGEEFDSYIGIAEGEVVGEIGPDLNEETSSAFLTSGMALDNIKANEGSNYFHYISESLHLTAACKLLGALSNAWTAIQSQTVLLAMTPKHSASYTQIAEKLGKSRQSVSKAIRATEWPSISAALTMIEYQEEKKNA